MYGKAALAGMVVSVAIAGGASASVASAAPRWARCVAAPSVNGLRTGPFKNKKCTKSATVSKGGKFKYAPVLEEQPFHASVQMTWHFSLPAQEQRPPFEIEVICAPGTLSGKLVPPNRVADIEIAMKQCKSNRPNQFGYLSSPNAENPGEVELGPLAGELGWLNEEAGEAGLALYSEAEPGAGDFGARGGGIYWSMREVAGGGSAPDIHWRGAAIGALSKGYDDAGSGFHVHFAVGAHLGEFKPFDHWYTPLTNPPGFEDGSPGFVGGFEKELITDNADVLVTELEPLGWRFPTGFEGDISAEKGAAKGIFVEG